MDSMSVMFSVMALVVVVSMVVAVVIKTIVVVLGRSQERADRAAAAKAEQAAAAEAEAASARDAAEGRSDPSLPPPHHVAAIAAAVSVIGAPRIVRIQRSGRETSWTAVARQAHQTSHNLRTKR